MELLNKNRNGGELYKKVTTDLDRLKNHSDSYSDLICAGIELLDIQ